MKKILSIALLGVLGTSIASELSARRCPAPCPAPRRACPAACTVSYETAERPLCEKMVPVTAEALCEKHIITTFSCPPGYTEV